MPSELRSASIYHVLYADTVGYTRHSLEAKAAVDEALRSAVQIRPDDEARILTVDTGDGFFMAFEGDPQVPCRAALRLRDELARRCSAKVRLGIHCGVAVLRDHLKAGVNMTGPAVEMAQRVMSLSTGQEILVSDAMASHLLEFEEWRPRLGRPRPMRLKDSRSLLVWELSDPEPAPAALVIVEDGAPEDTAAEVVQAVSATVPCMVAAARSGPADLADLARSSPSYLFLVLIGREGGLLQRGLIPEGSTDGEFGVGLISASTRAWFSRSSLDEFAAAVRSAAETPGAPKTDQYVERAADHQFRDALAKGAGIILVRAPRFSGKTSLLLRGLHQARRQGWNTVVTDFRALDHTTLASGEDLYRAIGRSFAAQHPAPPSVPEWNPELGPNTNLEAAIQAHLEASDAPTFWIWDSVERLFDGPYQDDLFGLLRSWHNRRAWEENGVWSRLTIALAYSTDAERLIKNPHQSPFNVGVRIDLPDLDWTEFKALHDLAGSPIVRTDELESAHALTGGDPYLSQLLFEGVARGQLHVADLRETRWPDSSDWGRHMASLCESVVCDPETLDALRAICRKARPDSPLAVLRLIHLGVLKPNLVQNPAFRSQAYERMFTRLLSR